DPVNSAAFRTLGVVVELAAAGPEGAADHSPGQRIVLSVCGQIKFGPYGRKQASQGTIFDVQVLFYQ
ncbi:MAG: hypothetical protein ACK5A3_04325, partial [Planctomyces sp.]